MVGLLEGKVAVVTGGARGIGLSTVERFVAEGAKVVIADILEPDGMDAARRLGDQATFFRTDVTSEAAIAGAVDAAVDAFGRLDVMFNNAAAGGDRSSILEIETAGFDDTIALVTRSVVMGHKYAARQFLSQGSGGSILSTASAAGLQGGWSRLAYTAGKHAVIGVVHHAAGELAPLGIRSNAIAPGLTYTPAVAHTFGVPKEHWAQFQETFERELAGTHPMGRVVRPDDVARVATFLASDLSQFVTGAVIPVDGGATAVFMGGHAEKLVAATTEFLASRQP